MLITRGKHKGRQARLHQYANDWISADLLPEGTPLILNPTSVQLEAGEADAMKAHTSTGSFWVEYSLDEVTGKFRKVRR